jgi:hypothetical protein
MEVVCHLVILHQAPILQLVLYDDVIHRVVGQCLLVDRFTMLPMTLARLVDYLRRDPQPD